MTFKYPNQWIGVDLDGTLAEHGRWLGERHIGQPIPLMVERVKRWLSEGKPVKIFTARVGAKGIFELPRDEMITIIQDWCELHIGVRLEVTHEKDFGMVELWDDRAVQVIPNTGLRADGKE